MKILALFVLVVALQLQSHGVDANTPAVEEERLRVEINVNYQRPSGFILKSPYYRIASAINLTCTVSGSAGQVSYNWSSDCSGNCFVKNKITESVSTLILQPSDSGTHTCTATDFVGVDCIRNASASVVLRIVGTGIFDEKAGISLSNNGIVKVDENQRLHISCWFSVAIGRTPQFIGTDWMNASRALFTITTTTSNRLTVMQVVTTTALSVRDEGVYTCRMPGETGLIDQNVGVYIDEVNAAPRISSLQQDMTDEKFKLVCVSTGSPPTNVIWTKDNSTLRIDGATYKMTQTVTNRTSSTYENVLVIEDSIDSLPGEYSCAIENVFGISNKEITTGKVIQIFGHEDILIVGRMAHLRCSTHLRDYIKMQWLLGGIAVPLKSSTTQEVVLSVELESTGLDGAMFTCKVTASGGSYEETIALKVKDFENIVTITEQPMPVTDGESLVLTCLVRADDSPTVQWLNPNGVPVIDSDTMFVDGPFVDGNKTTLSLYFIPVYTSHGGRYTCRSQVTFPLSLQTATLDVIVQIPAPIVRILQIPAGNPAYTTSSLMLNCTIGVHEVVDTGIEVDSSLSGPGGVLLTSDRISVSQLSGIKPIYNRVAFLNNLKSSDTGTYGCVASLRPNVPSAFIVASGQSRITLNITVALNVSIAINYSPPPDVHFEPPYYRPATSVTLTCSVLGATGSVNYRWSSTSPCSENSCFASSSSSTSVSTTRLSWRDAGMHTCTVSDAGGNQGNATSEMNIEGAGMYVFRTLNPSGAVPNNTIVRYRSTRYYNFGLYCIANSSSTGQFTAPDGHTRASNYGRLIYSNQGNGIIYLYNQYRYWPSTGVYTCKMLDANGMTVELTFGLYTYSFTAPPRVTALRHFPSTDNFTLECTSTDSVATFVTWVKDGGNLTIDGRTYKQVQKVTSRYSSSYQNLLLINDTPSTVPGVYTCIVSNLLGASNQSITIHGLQISGYEDTLTVGKTANISCSSDLDITSIVWLDSDMIPVVESVTSDVRLQFLPVSTVSHGQRYTCRVYSPYGIQEKVVTISSRIPDAWATIDVEPITPGAPLDGQEYSLMCVVRLVGGLPSDTVSVTWLGPDGKEPYENEIEVASVVISVNYLTAVLTFNPLNSSHGGSYVCKASTTVPGLNTPPPLSQEFELVVTSISLFQLRMGPVQYCIHWTVDRALHVESAIKDALTSAIRDRCTCNFSVDAIDDGEFSCQSTVTEVVYRSKINGTSDMFTAPELLTFVEDWIANEGTFTIDVFRLRTNAECPLHIQTFHQPECAVNATLSSISAGCYSGNCLASV